MLALERNIFFGPVHLTINKHADHRLDLAIEKTDALIRQAEALGDRNDQRQSIERQISSIVEYIADPRKVEDETKRGDRAAEYLKEVFASSLAADQAEIAYNRGVLAQSRFDFSGAYREYRAAVDLRPKEISYLNAAGRVAFLIGDLRDAERCFEGVLRLSLDGGSQERARIFALGNLASALYEGGDAHRAEVLLRRAEEELCCDGTAKWMDLKIGIASNLGQVLGARGELDEAERKLEQALGWTTTSECARLTTAQIVSNLGELSRRQGDYRKAASHNARSLRLRNEQVGLINPASAESLNNMGALCRDVRDFDLAETLLEAALEISERYLGKSHTRVAIGVNNLGMLLMDKGEYEKAEVKFLEAKEILAARFGESHQQVLAVYENLRVLQKRLIGRGSEWLG